MIKAFIFAALFVVLAIIFLMGKGDMLIAGYNTAPEEKRKKIDIHRLRLLMAIICITAAIFCSLMYFIGKDTGTVLTAGVIFMAITVVLVILANTWAKKK